MSHHSKILVHWTGKKIEKLEATQKPQLYVNRLEDYLKKGLFAKRTSEDSIRGLIVKNLIRLCFTEIRLSHAKEHSNRYGKLGIGFTRKFVMDKGGRPAIYIPYHPVAGNCILEDSIKKIYENTINIEDISRSSKYILAHVKRMTSESGEDYYEEMEWRLVFDENSRTFEKVKNKEEYRLKFSPKDIKVIIFPDEETKQLALKNVTIRNELMNRMPTLVTLDDATNF